jgi:exodeoxyribonuclease VII large subunit
MQQLTFFQPPSWTVTDLTDYLRELLESHVQLQDLWVQGEVSNLSHPSSGHLYFTLKDEGAALRCVMWRNAVAQQTFIPREGDALEAHGSISIYEVSGQYQLYVDSIRLAGEGALYQEFLRLKARLEVEGLFDEARKRAIPVWPQCIGIVTSPTGAALRDMLNTLRRRFPIVKVALAPTSVQGSDAPAGIIAALNGLNEIVWPDVILLARGGGAIEDLWAFNDEGVARAIVTSQAPVITGVGHETDFTIADFVADLRAPTPTAAAELATPDQADMKLQLTEAVERSWRTVSICLSSLRRELDAQTSRLDLFSPLVQIRRDRQFLDGLVRRAGIALTHNLKLQRTGLDGIEQRLKSLSPQSVLDRGYAIVSAPDGRLIRRVAQVGKGDELDVQVSDGAFGVRVDRLDEKEE